VVEHHHHAWTINKFYSTDLHLNTMNTKHNWDSSYNMWNFPAWQANPVHTCNNHVEAHGGHFMYFLYSAWGHKSETTFQKAYIYKTFLSCIVVSFHPL
jgi:hypothetical protein